jgi:hypothetical protein
MESPIYLFEEKAKCASKVKESKTSLSGLMNDGPVKTMHIASKQQRIKMKERKYRTPLRLYHHANLLILMVIKNYPFNGMTKNR